MLFNFGALAAGKVQSATSQAVIKYKPPEDAKPEKPQEIRHLEITDLERIGDLSVNVGEDTVFMEEAIDVRHERDREI